MTETPVDDTENSYVVTVSVDDGEGLIDLHAESGPESIADVTMTIEETLALIASLTVAVTEALQNR